jgi:hypothetical protein
MIFLLALFFQESYAQLRGFNTTNTTLSASTPYFTSDYEVNLPAAILLPIAGVAVCWCCLAPGKERDAPCS